MLYVGSLFYFYYTLLFYLAFSYSPLLRVSFFGKRFLSLQVPFYKMHTSDIISPLYHYYNFISDDIGNTLGPVADAENVFLSACFFLFFF